jgi:hypothetical protein
MTAADVIKTNDEYGISEGRHIITVKKESRAYFK